QRRQQDNRREGARLGKEQHCHGSRKHGQHNRPAAANSIGQMSTQRRGRQETDAVGSNCKSGLGRRKSQARHVERQERNDKSAELVEKSSREQNPYWPWQISQRRERAGSQRRRGHTPFSVCVLVHEVVRFEQQKTLLTFRQAGWKNLCLVKSDWSLLPGSFNRRSNVPGNTTDVHALGEVR